METPCCSCFSPPLREPGYHYGYALVRGPSILQTLKECGCSSPQFYLGGSSVTTGDIYRPVIENKEEILKFCEENSQTFYIHCPLNINFANPTSRNALSMLRNHLTQTLGLPCGCVLHVGREGVRRDKGTLETVAERLNRVDKEGVLRHSPWRRVPYSLLLEVAAGQKGELGKNLEELRRLYEVLDRSKVGFCLDTQHIFANGMCSFENPEEMVNLYEELLSITPHGMSLVHLNDSLVPFNSHLDRHAPLAQGYIWRSSTDSLIRLLELCTGEGIDIVTETCNPSSDLTLLSSFS